MENNIPALIRKGAGLPERMHGVHHPAYMPQASGYDDEKKFKKVT